MQHLARHVRSILGRKEDVAGHHFVMLAWAPGRRLRAVMGLFSTA
jgi:hypothetical protein